MVAARRRRPAQVTGLTLGSVEVKRVSRAGVTEWESKPSHKYLPRRTLRHLAVAANAELRFLSPDIEPFFQETGDAAQRLRDVLREFGVAEACIHSTWLNRPERCGVKAEKWLDAVGGNEWWSKDVSWRFSDSDLRVLAVSDPDFQTTSLYAWGGQSRKLLDQVAAAWESLPKVPASGE